MRTGKRAKRNRKRAKLAKSHNELEKLQRMGTVADTNSQATCTTSMDRQYGQQRLPVNDTAEEVWNNQENDENTAEGGDEVTTRNELFTKKLRSWALSHNVRNVALTDLLLLLRQSIDFKIEGNIHDFLNPPMVQEWETKTEVIDDNGTLWYRGIQNTMQSYFSSATPAADVIFINLNVSCVLNNSNKSANLWPLMLQLQNVPQSPTLLVGMYCGSSNPSNVETLLRPFVDELNQILDNGIKLNGKLIAIFFRAIIARGGSKAFIHGVDYGDAKIRCVKCNLLGTYASNSRKIIFKGVKGEPNVVAYGIDAHQHPTPLLDITGINIVDQTLIADERDLIHFGFMKKLLVGCKNGSLAPIAKWQREEQNEVSSIIKTVHLPREVDACVRPFKELDSWEADEFRSFFHHISVPLLKDRLPPDVYSHFLLLHVAITLLSSKTFETRWKYAEDLLNQFIKGFPTLYDRNQLGISEHYLLHLASDVLMFGPLPTISSSPFQDKIKFIKSLIRQDCGRLIEEFDTLTKLLAEDETYEVESANYPSLEHEEDEEVLRITASFMLKADHRDGWFLTKDLEILRYSSADITCDSIVINSFALNEKKLAFTRPCNSHVIYTFDAKTASLSQGLRVVRLSEVLCKLAAVSVDKGITYTFSPVVRTILDS